MEEKRIHPMILEAREEVRKGNMTRRGFLRLATLLGLSLSSAELFAFGSVRKARAASSANIVRGGVMKAATRIERGPSRPFFADQRDPTLA